MKYTAQVWDGSELVAEVRGVDIVVADHIASQAPVRGYTGRRIPETGKDWAAWRCWFPDGRTVTGQFSDGATRRTVETRAIG